MLHQTTGGTHYSVTLVNKFPVTALTQVAPGALQQTRRRTHSLVTRNLGTPSVPLTNTVMPSTLGAIGAQMFSFWAAMWCEKSRKDGGFAAIRRECEQSQSVWVEKRPQTAEIRFYCMVWRNNPSRGIRQVPRANCPIPQVSDLETVCFSKNSLRFPLFVAAAAATAQGITAN